MRKKILKIALVGNTNAGKSTLLNSFTGETVSIVNKKINTTQDLIKGIINSNNIQIIFYDTPGINYLKNSQKEKRKFKINLWEGLERSDIILYIIDSSKFNIDYYNFDIQNLFKLKKKIIVVFNKTDLVKNDILLPIIDKIKSKQIHSFFNISAKFNRGVNHLFKNLIKFSKFGKWLYLNDEITDKDDTFIATECTRNAILKFLHKELPYNVIVKNILFKRLKNKNIKIKQMLMIKNSRYKKIILGKKGEKIKNIREHSQSQISKILNCKIHLYLEILKNDG